MNPLLILTAIKEGVKDKRYGCLGGEKVQNIMVAKY